MRAVSLAPVRPSPEGWVRLGAAALAPALAVTTGNPNLVWFLAALAYALVTVGLAPRPWGLVGDLVAGVMLVVATEGLLLPALPFLLFVVVRASRHVGVRGGAGTGAVIAATVLATLAAAGWTAELGLAGMLATAALFPLVGVTTASLLEAVGRTDGERQVLQEANRLLSSLRAVADHLPGGLDVATVSAALVAEVRGLPGCRAAMVLVDRDGVLEVAAASGVPDRRRPAVRLDELRDRAGRSAATTRFLTPRGLPEALAGSASAARHWAVLALGDAPQLSGAMLAGFDDLDRGREARARLASIAVDGGLALDNARLFDGTQARATDTARRRLAGDLHDGVAQSLAHLRMELELRTLAADDGDRDELKRLASLAGHTLEELRTTIGVLRRSTERQIDEQLRRHIDRLISDHGPTLEFSSFGTTPVPPERADHVLRIAQEALSNALRHSGAGRIEVTLERDAGTLELTVEDDGSGLPLSPAGGTGGVGLPSMRDRAARLGGSLDVRARVGGGTVVHLRCPTRAPRSR